MRRDRGSGSFRVKSFLYEGTPWPQIVANRPFLRMVLVVCLGNGIVQVLSPQVEEPKKKQWLVHLYPSTRQQESTITGLLGEVAIHSHSFQVMRALPRSCRYATVSAPPHQSIAALEKSIDITSWQTSRSIIIAAVSIYQVHEFALVHLLLFAVLVGCGLFRFASVLSRSMVTPRKGEGVLASGPAVSEMISSKITNKVRQTQSGSL